ncbi:MAG: PAS domain S-box protein [Synergistaceae bacterium]|nr:PAS domain S-box protein [Synergistaceae bacterium]
MPKNTLLASDALIYKDLVESSPDLICRFLPDTTVTFANEALCRALEIDRSELLGRHFSELIPPEEVQPAREKVGSLSPEQPSSSYLLVFPLANDAAYVVHWKIRGYFDPEGRLLEVHAFGREDSERVTAKQAHENERRRAITLFDNSPEGILASWDGIHIDEANQAFCRMTGFSQEELLGTPLKELFSRGKQKRGLCLRRFTEKTGSGETVVEEGTFTTKMGEQLFLSLLAIPVREPSEKGKGLYMFFRNLTALKENEELLLSNIEKLHAAFSQTVEVLALTVEIRDPYTAGHQRRTALLSLEIARRMGLDEETCRGIYLAAAIHDVGKISVPSEILSRPGKLLDIEFSLVKAHAEEGYKILKNVDFPWKIADIVRRHHERLDGSGYPQGLKNEEIPLEARIVAVADTVEAMASHRPYRPSLGVDTALRFVEEGKDRLFDRNVVDACSELFAEGYSFESDGAAPALLH